jgi:hypothetical protein
LRAFSIPSLFAEQWRIAWSSKWVDLLSGDLRYLFRTLRRAPGLTAIVPETVRAPGLG